MLEIKTAPGKGAVFLFVNSLFDRYVRVGNQRQMARTFNGASQLALVAGVDASLAAWADFAFGGQEALEQLHILVIDL